MARYILGRLLGLIFVLFVVSMITFFLTRAVPGDPFAAGERELPEATRIARAAKYGFDQPLIVQYGRYIWNVLHGDFGVPFQSPTQSVVDLIKQTWPVTMRIGALTILIAYPLGIALGLLAKSMAIAASTSSLARTATTRSWGVKATIGSSAVPAPTRSRAGPAGTR